MNEDYLIKACTERDETARMLSRVFSSEWLRNAELRPLFITIKEFIQKHDIAPSTGALREILSQNDPILYKNRIAPVIDRIDSLKSDNSIYLHVIDEARQVAIARSLRRLIDSQEFHELEAAENGPAMIEAIESWMKLFSESTELVEMDLKQAVESFIDKSILDQDQHRIKTGIDLIDSWSGHGGLSKRQIAILMAPTGHGKSAILSMIAHNIAKQLDKRVLFVTNELSIEDTAARMLARITATPLDHVYRDIAVSRSHYATKAWESGLHNYIRLVEVVGEVDSDFIDSILDKYRNLYAWKPDVLIVDFMERMKPTVSINRDKEWNWIGQIAKDLLRLAKRRNLLVWTAGQTNRGGMNMKAEPNMSFAQGSIKHFQEAAMVISVRKLSGYPGVAKDSDVLELACQKARHGVAGERVWVEACLAKMTLRQQLDSAKVKEALGDEEERKVSTKNWKMKLRGGEDG